MPGPLPKAADQRRRRNADTFAVVQLPSEGRTDPPPALPSGFRLSAARKAWWKKVWRSPMATQWTDEDVPVLARLGMLTDSYLSDPESVNGKVLSEMRSLEEQFGLTPKARRALRWVIVEDELAAARADRESEGAGRPKRRLAAVDSSAG